MKHKKISSKNKNIIWAVVSLALAVFTVNTVLRQSRTVSGTDLLNALAASDKRWLVPAVICTVLFVWFEGLAIRSILRDAGYKCRYIDGLIYSTSDIFFSAITPSATGGQPASAFFMHENGIPGGVVSAVLVLNLMMYTVSMVVLGVISICIMPEAFLGLNILSRALIIFGFAALIFLSLLFLSLLKKGEFAFAQLSKFILFLNRKGIIRRPEPKLKKVEKISADYKKCSGLLAENGSIKFHAFLWNFLQRTAQIIVPVFIYLSIGGSTDKSLAIFAKQCVVTIGYNFIPIPGAMGVSDYLMIDAFNEIMGWETAFSTEMLSRGITFYTCVAVCGIITLIGYLVRRKRNDRSI